MIGLAGGAKDLAQDLDQDLAEMATLGSLLTSSSYLRRMLVRGERAGTLKTVHLSSKGKGTLNCLEIPLHSSYVADFESDSSQMLAKMWSKWNIYLLLAGV